MGTRLAPAMAAVWNSHGSLTSIKQNFPPAWMRSCTFCGEISSGIDSDKVPSARNCSHNSAVMQLKVFLAIFASTAVLTAQPTPRVVDPGSAAKAPSDATVLFDGKDLSAFTRRNGTPHGCEIKNEELHCASGSGDLYSRLKFKDAQIHLEFNPPLMADQKGQLRGNSGVKLHGRYEIQILDSYNNPTYSTGIAAALYTQAPPLVNAARPPEQWQSYDIIFHGPRCTPEGKLLAQGTVTVIWNGVLAQDHTPILDSAKGCVEAKGKEEGPLMLQDHSGFKNAPHTIMRFRNIWIRELK